MSDMTERVLNCCGLSSWGIQLENRRRVVGLFITLKQRNRGLSDWRGKLNMKDVFKVVAAQF